MRMVEGAVTQPGSLRSLRLLVLIFAVGCLLFSGVYSYLAPYGWWSNYIFGRPAWGEHDPACFYVEAAHQLAWGEAPLFLGHPGSTLVLLLLGVQRTYYALGPSDGLSFTQFTARNLPTVFLLSKLLMTRLHLVSFVALFAYAKKLMRD